MGAVKDKVALVTGGSSGIGRAAATLLHARGAIPWIADIDIDRATAAAWELGGRALLLDVRDAVHWGAAIDVILSRSGRLDVLINAAGISRTPAVADVLETTLDDWRTVFAVNVEGTLLGAQHAVRAMGERGGAIVNISSTTANAPTVPLGAYGASKAAVLQLTKSIAAACAARGFPIRCNAVLPGMTETPMTAGMPLDYKAAWEAQIPLKRFASSDEVAEAIVFLAGDGASYINGTGLLVDGGLTARPVVA